MNQIWTIAQTHPVPPCTIVIFGASGDLAARKLLPALYNLEHCGKDAIPPKLDPASPRGRIAHLQQLRGVGPEIAGVLQGEGRPRVARFRDERPHLAAARGHRIDARRHEARRRR